MYLLKTLRVTVLSTGDSVIFEQAGNQAIGRNHQDLTGHARSTCFGPNALSWPLLGAPQGPLKYRGGVSMGC